MRDVPGTGATRDAAARFRLRLLGAPELLDHAGNPVPGIGTGKPLAVLSYLAVEGRAARAEVVDLLWGGSEESNARNAFRQALHRLRAVLGDTVEGSGDTVRLAVDGDLWCDVVAYERALSAGRWREAVALYTGEFLSGFDPGESSFSHWADGERARLRARQQDALERVARERFESGDLGAAAAYARDLMEIAGLDPDAAVLQARVLAASGARAEAVAALRRFQTEWTDELRSEPPATVTGLLDRLTNGGRAGGSPMEPAAAGPGPGVLVGRERELGLVLGRWQGVAEGAGATMVVSGPTGIGKTRVLDEVAARVPTVGPALLLRGGARLAGAEVPYAGLAATLRPVLRAPGLAGASSHLLAEAARLLPELRDRFDLPAAAPMEDETARVRFFEGVASMLEAVAYETPVCMIIDDAHRLSPSTMDLLAYLSARLRASAVLLVVALTEEGKAPPPVARLLATVGQGGDAATTLTLGELEHEAALTLATDALREEDGDPSEATRVVGLAGGHPLRIREAARRVASGTGSAAPLVGAAEILRARVASVSTVERRLLVAVALLGGRAPVTLAAAAAHIPEAAAREVLPRLVRLDLLDDRADGIAPASEVAARTAVADVVGSARAMYSHWAADAAAAHGGVPHAVIAALYQAAGRGTEAAAHSRAAGLEAAATGAFGEAADAFTRALELTEEPASRREIEGLLEAMGRAPARRLAGQVDGQPGDGGPESERVRGGTRRTLAGIGVAGAAALLVAALLWLQPGGSERAPSVAALQDTLLLGAGFAGRADDVYYATGDIAGGAALSRWRRPVMQGPDWAASVSLPWMNATTSPDGAHVAVERAATDGTELYIITADRADTVRLAGPGEDFLAAGWSPDGAWLLALRGRASGLGHYTSDLLAYSVADRRPLAIDTVTDRHVTHAVWSPTGLNVAWIAWSGADLVVYVSDADGRATRPLATGVADGQALAWDPYGTSVAFLREADGTRALFSADVGDGAVRRITFDDGHHANPAFSPDGRLIAFERSEPEGTGVYVVGARGGDPRRVAPAEDNLSIVGWRGGAPQYVDRLRAAPPDLRQAGDRGSLVVRGVDQRGGTVPLERVLVSSLDPGIVRVNGAGNGGRDGDAAVDLVAQSVGIARLVVDAGGWRRDTVMVRVGRDRQALVGRGGAGGVDPGSWRAVGPFPPAATARGVEIRNRAPFPSGLLSVAPVPLGFGLELEAEVRSDAGFVDARDAELVFGLVALESDAELDASRPGLMTIAAVHWLGDSGRLAYSVGREVWTEPVRQAATGDAMRLKLEVDDDGRVRFHVDDVLRWTSTTRLAAAGRALAWIGGGSADGAITVTGVDIALPAR